MEYLQMSVSFQAVRDLIQRSSKLKYLLDENIEVMAVPLHGGYYKDDIFVDRFAPDEMCDKAKNEGFQFVTRNQVSYIKNGRLTKQFVVVGTGYNVIKVYENGMSENNY